MAKSKKVGGATASTTTIGCVDAEVPKVSISQWHAVNDRFRHSAAKKRSGNNPAQVWLMVQTVDDIILAAVTRPTNVNSLLQAHRWTRYLAASSFCSFVVCAISLAILRQ
ncbi:hypothetical protein [Tianweitania sp.]|uniref:hypothetical protein n=1 Tax=Tianweitania sp. TaxID=2021634 RepID=UPI00289B8747|nr:hypothetical protein [Tianweitania sp.]